MRVLVIGAGGLGPVATMKSLAARGADCVLAVEEGYPAPARFSRYCRERWTLPAIARGPAFTAALLERLRARPVDVVLPLSDAVIRAMATERVAIEALAGYAAPPAEAVAIATDKGRLARVLAARDDVLHPPLTIGPEDPDSAASLWPDRFPVLIKPRSASGTEGVRLARTRDELEATYRQVHATHPLPILQELLDYRPGEKFTLQYLFDRDGRLRAQFMTRVTDERALIKIGTGEAVRRGGIGLTRSSGHDPDMLARGRRTFEALGWRGFGFLEVIRDPRDRDYRVIDINPRLPGSAALPLQLGIEFAQGACLVALGLTPPEQLVYPTGTKSRRSFDIMLNARSTTSLAQIVDPRYRAPTNLLSDPMPVLAALAALATDAISRRKR